jgi:2-polyprenyl-6-methoxyphenol hydroxylase-like FAD-dependent oxidoreductase
MDQPRARVIGGSLGGLLTANLLRKIGWNVAVFERAEGDLAGRGAGLGTRAELFEVMRRIGIDFSQSIRVEVRSRIGLDRHGPTMREVPVCAITTAWNRMSLALKTALPSEFYRRAVGACRFQRVPFRRPGG